MRPLFKSTLLCAALVASTLHAAERRPLHGVVNLNTATLGELDLLPGVGQATAERIIAFRQRHPFKRPEELVRVKGFGRKKLQRLAPYLSVSGPTTLAQGPPPAAVPPGQPVQVQGRAAPPAR